MDCKDSVLETLDSLSIPYRYFEHAPAYSMADCAALDAETGMDESGSHCKNLLLANRQNTAFYLVVTDGDKRFSTKDFCRGLNIPRVSFAKEEDMVRLLRCHPGAVSPLGLLFDEKREVTLVCDAGLRDKSELLFHPCVNTATVELSAGDFFGPFLKRTGHVPVFVEIPTVG